MPASTRLWARIDRCLRARPVPSIRPANSTLIRNAVEDLLGEDFEGSFESEYLAWAVVESLLDPSQVRIGDGTDWR